jgi:hypothetical protein
MAPTASQPTVGADFEIEARKPAMIAGCKVELELI